MASQDELLQRIAAAAIPRKLGRLYSRYGQPAPVLGSSAGGAFPASSASGAVLGRGRPAPAAGLAGRPESQQPDNERLQKYAELPDSADQSAALAEQGEGGMSPAERSDAVEQYGGVVDGVEDLMDDQPDLTRAEIDQYAQDHQRSGIGWEDWRDQRNAGQ